MMKKTVGVGLIILGLAVSVGCGLELPGSNTTVITNTNTNNQGGTDPTVPPVVPVPTGAIDHVKVTQFGGTCDEEDPRQVTVGCQKFLTCTPFFADGTLVPPAIHGSAPTFFGVTVGSQFVSVSIPEENFNRDVRGLSPGVAFFECEVKGVRSPPFDLTVVAAEGLTVRDFLPWTIQ